MGIGPWCSFWGDVGVHLTGVLRPLDLSIVIPALNEEENLRGLLPRLCEALSHSPIAYEMIVVNGASVDDTALQARACGATVVQQTLPGYGGALQEGIGAASGRYILTLDADQSHDPAFVGALWEARHGADIVLGSRYSSGGRSEGEFHRRLLSTILNLGLKWSLDLPVHDLTGGFRLYRASAVKGLSIRQRDFASLVEILVKVYGDGWRVTELPFSYRRREHGNTHARLLAFGLGYLRTAYEMWLLRNSIACADYDNRAYDSRIPLQRYWQRRRCEIVTEMARGCEKVLDLGCGSSRTLLGLKGHVVGLDIQVNKLRFARVYQVPLVNGDAFCLPFPDQTFDCVVCSQVIEHLPSGDGPFAEMVRVLKPRGRLIIGTPDYGTVSWRVIERLYRLAAPNAYADEHITHYTRKTLIGQLQKYGYAIGESEYILGAELIIAFSASIK
jgi:ubiquinone/menaquinone biosynthesis C-methylase UbiE